MEIARYKSIDAYLKREMKKHLIKIMQFLLVAILAVSFSILLIDSPALLKLSLYTTRVMNVAPFLISGYILKLFLLYNTILLWFMYLILKHRYESILLGCIIATACLVFLDIIVGTHFITLSYSEIEVIYFFGYLFMYYFSFALIKKKYKLKELW